MGLGGEEWDPLRRGHFGEPRVLAGDSNLLIPFSFSFSRKSRNFAKEKRDLTRSRSLIQRYFATYFPILSHSLEIIK